MAVSLVGKGRQAFALSKLVWFTLPKDDNPNGRETNLKYTSLRKEEEWSGYHQVTPNWKCHIEKALC